jgi:hypothetical protein
MPRYFFDFKDGRDYKDDTGYELPDIKAVREHALKTSGEMLRDGGRADIWEGEEWSLKVNDQNGRCVLTIRFSAEQHPDV